MYTLEEFIKQGKIRNSWVEFGPLSAYVRKGYHTVDGRLITTFDIANVVVADESKRGRGAFRSFLIELRGILRFELPPNQCPEALYVENVQQERFRNFFRANGWTEIPCPESLGDPCFYLMFEARECQ